MSESLAITPAGRPQLEYLPVSLFGSVTGLAALSAAWRIASFRYGAPLWLSQAIGLIAIAAFIAMALGYAIKWISAPEAISAEFHHPIAGNLFGTFFLSLLLLPMAIAPLSLVTARVCWALGAVGMVAFAWLIVSRWMTDRQQIAHATPAWFIPVVGLLDVPLAMPALDLPSLQGLMVFPLAVGLFFAVPLFTLVFSRLVFEPPMPDALKPTLLILVAPFAIGYSSYTITTGQADLFSESLYMLTLFVLAVLLGQMRYLTVCCPFRVSWWAVSFPLAACSITALRFAAANPNWFAEVIAELMLAFASLVIAGLSIRTLLGLAKGELRNLST